LNYVTLTDRRTPSFLVLPLKRLGETGTRFALLKRKQLHRHTALRGKARAAPDPTRRKGTVLLLINLLFVVVVSVAIGAMFSIGLRGRNEWAGTFWLFVILFFGTWALGSWLRPIGPLAWDVYWVPYVVAAAVIALLLAAVTPIRTRSVHGQKDDGSNGGDPPTMEAKRNLAQAILTLSVFFWLLLGLSILAILLQQL
jgi:hypothetical protein